MTPAARHRRVAARFSALVDGTTGWDAPAPVHGWSARDVVLHLVTWSRGFLDSRIPGSSLEAIDDGDHPDDPAAAWHAHAAGVQALLDGPRAEVEIDDPRLGRHRLGDLLDRIYTGDVFLHTWDLARATGQDDTLDPTTCAEMLAGMEPIEDVMRSSGQYGARVEVPDDADVQTRLLGFIGRDPRWTAPPTHSTPST